MADLPGYAESPARKGTDVTSTSAQYSLGDTSADGTEPGAAMEFARHLVNEDADIREGMRADRTEPWCPEHGYGCEPQNCPCGHSLRCDCWDIANEH